MTQDKNTPAFPHNLDSLQFETAGMSLRDYFAAKALAGIADTYKGQAMDPISTARSAYKFADAMLEERK